MKYTVLEEDIYTIYIYKFTIKYALDMKNISFKEIVIRISSNNISEFNINRFTRISYGCMYRSRTTRRYKKTNKRFN